MIASANILQSVGCGSIWSKGTEIRSRCSKCGKEGNSRALQMDLPGFGQINVSRLECESCNKLNLEVISLPSMEHGTRVTCIISSIADLERPVLISSHCILNIDGLELAFPRINRIGTLKNILIEALDFNTQEEPSDKSCTIYKLLMDVLDLKKNCIITLEDCTGNSYIGSLDTLEIDSNVNTEKLNTVQKHDNVKISDEDNGTPPGVYEFQGTCTGCNSECITKTQIISIPHFDNVIIWATNCDVCGYKNNEVKSISKYSDKGKRITFKITSPDDFNREVLKSDTCSIEVKELGLNIGPQILKGIFTTVEGILRSSFENLKSVSPYSLSCSGKNEEADLDEDSKKFNTFLERFEKAVNMEILPLTFIMDDPSGCSIKNLQNIYAPDPDPNIGIEFYTCTEAQQEECGISNGVIDI